MRMVSSPAFTFSKSAYGILHAAVGGPWHALGLDPRVESGSQTRTCARCDRTPLLIVWPAEYNDRGAGPRKQELGAAQWRTHFFGAQRSRWQLCARSRRSHAARTTSSTTELTTDRGPPVIIHGSAASIPPRSGHDGGDRESFVLRPTHRPRDQWRSATSARGCAREVRGERVSAIAFPVHMGSLSDPI